MAGFPTEVMARLPPEVRDATFRPAISSLKFPEDVLGANPAIKLLVAGFQVGVNGKGPFSLFVETTRAAWTEPTKASMAAQTNIIGILRFPN